MKHMLNLLNSNRFKENKVRETEGKRASLDRFKIILAGLGFMLLFWIIESLIHVFVFNEGNVHNQIFYPNAHEFWMRSLLVSMIFLFSLFAQYMVDNHRKSEEMIKESHAELDQIFNTSADGMRVIDKDFNVLRVNETFSKMANVTMEEANRSKCYDIFSGPFCHTPDCPLKRITNGEKCVECETEKERADGSKIPCIVYATPFKDPEGKLIGIVEDFRGITERKKYEEALRESEGKLNAMLQSIGDHMSLMDRDLNITWANDVAKQIFGEDIVGKKCYEVYHKRDKPCEPYPCLTLKAFEDGRIHEHETSVINKDGEKRYFHCTANVALRDNEGNPVGVIEISRDITEQKLTEMSLEREIRISAAVANLSSALLSSVSVEEISELVLEHAKRLTQSNVGYVGYIEPHTGYMISPTMKGEIWDRCQVENKDTVFKKFGGLWGWVLNNKEPILTNAPEEDPRSGGLPPGHIPVDRFLSVPATINRELVGLISLANSERDYTERDIALVERLADLFAIAIKRKQTEDELQEERNKLEA
ncbi:MAG: PAS domain S-box protein, partial [Archaeoglobaceae archaeon]